MRLKYDSINKIDFFLSSEKWIVDNYRLLHIQNSFIRTYGTYACVKMLKGFPISSQSQNQNKNTSGMVKQVNQ